MVIAHVLSSLKVGGQERVALDLASGQVRAGHDVRVVSLAPPPDGPLADAFRERSVRVERVAKRQGLDPTLPLRLAALFRRARVDVVHTHNRMPLIYAGPAAKLSRARLVHTRHGPGRGSARERVLWRLCGRLVDAYVAVSPELAALARELGDCPPERILVIENGIDLGRFRPDAGARREVREALGIPAGAFVLGSVGRLAVEKDYPLLVRAAAPLLGKGTYLVLVGEGAERPAIEAAAAAAGVSPFVLLAGATGEVHRFLAALDAFVLSSRMEGLPLSALEAMAAGLPLLATAVGGLPGLIKEGVTGYLVPPGDEQALREGLRALRDDPQAARAVAARGQAHVAGKHGRETMVDRYLSIYVRPAGARAGAGALP
jgi:glycosyltransferase involved in cell wall biosynthesis